MVYTGDSNPENWIWDFHYFSAVSQPVTATLEAAKCLNQWYVYGGSGKYYSWSDAVPGASLFGFPFLCDDKYQGPDGRPCSTVSLALLDRDSFSIPSAGEATICSQFASINSYTNLGYGWQIPLNSGYAGDLTGSLVEQCVTDPVFSRNGIFFTTMEHDHTSACGVNEIKSRIWALNCATGRALNDTICSNLKVKETSSTVYLPTSTGAINKLIASDSSDGSAPSPSPSSPPPGASEWVTGAPPETAPILGRPTHVAKEGEIIHWIER